MYFSIYMVGLIGFNRYVLESGCEGAEVLMILGLPSSSDGGQGAAVEGVDGGDDDWRFYICVCVYICI
jgi:hypothetical protein